MGLDDHDDKLGLFPWRIICLGRIAMKLLSLSSRIELNDIHAELITITGVVVRWGQRLHLS